MTVLIVYGMTRLVGISAPPQDTAPTAPIRFTHVDLPDEPQRRSRQQPPRRIVEPAPVAPVSPVPDARFDSLSARASLGRPDVAQLLMAYEPDLNIGWQGGDMLAGGLIPTVMLPPMYPHRALLKGLEGEVVVGFTVADTGVVADAWIISAVPEDVFDEAALKAVTRWRFRPPRGAEGEPITVEGQQAIAFLLRDPPATAGSN